jgi:hypothetical protein
MNIYDWEIGSFIGIVEAKDIKEAIIKVVTDYCSHETPPPYLSDEFMRLEVRVKLRKLQ